MKNFVFITPTLKIPTNFEMFQTYIKFLKNIFGFIVDGVIAIGLILGIVAVIIGGIYFFLSSLSVPVIVNVNGFLTISVPLLIMFAIFKIISYRKKKKNINTMNHIRFNSDTLIDDELMNLIENNSIGEFERIGYMAAFADRYPPRKNLVDSSKS